MPRQDNQKSKLLVLARILLRETDEAHPMTVARMLELLRAAGVAVSDRKTLYSDLEALRTLGMDIATRRDGRSVGYFVGARLFELPELRLLVDAAQSSRFITGKKTAQLIERLGTLCSVHQAGTLRREVHVAGRVKSMNESVYYTVDALSTAMQEGEQVSFRYLRWTAGPQGRPVRAAAHGGARYRVSPWALVWNTDNYYLVAGCEGETRHFRVDKLDGLQREHARREGPPAGFDPAAYGREVFGMFGGQERTVQLALPERLLDAAVDRFGPALALRREGGQVVLSARVVLSPQFYAWVFGLGPEVALLSPADVRDGMAAMLRAAAQQYADR